MKVFLEFTWRLAVVALLGALLSELIRIDTALQRAEANSPFAKHDPLDVALSELDPLHRQKPIDVRVINDSVPVDLSPSAELDVNIHNEPLNVRFAR